MNHTHPFWALVAAAALLNLTACGSSSDTVAAAPPVTATASTLITGTAASGAPIIGKVTVKDSTGTQKTVDIEADGKYTIDVSGMTGPFLFRAVGNVGGREVSLASTATASDVGKTINITPFTDLVVANIAGMASAQFYDAPVFAKLTAAEIDAARNQLTTRLLPILNALGVEAGFDLLRSAFTADHTKFDAVMDVVKVTVDAATNKATIADLVNNTRIEDDLASKSDTTALPAPATALGTTVTDLIAINQVLKNITALFANGIPAASNAVLRNSLASDFMNDGASLEQFLSTDNLLSVENVGLKFLSATILERVDSNTLWVTLTGSDASGSWNDKVMFKAGSDGVWRLAGNRQIASIDVHSINDRWMGVTPPIFNRRLEFWVDSGASNTIQYASVSGPGLSQTIGLVRSASDDENFHIEGYSYTTSWINECGSLQETTPCVNFSQVPNDAVYTVTFYDHKNGTAWPETTTLVLPRPPVSNAEASANASAWFATPTPVSFLPSTYQNWADGSGITLTWSLPTDSSYRMSHFGMNAPTTVGSIPTTIAFRKNLTATQSSATLGNWSGVAPTSAPNYWLFTEGTYNRRFTTNSNYPSN
jgi:hypothetical protein